jgi:hypothetical protein
MNISIINPDKTVVVDGSSLQFEFDLPDTVWAIQWNGITGEVENTDGTHTQLTDFSEYQYILDDLAAEKKRRSDELTQSEADRISSLTYAEKRAQEYPPIEDQLDDIFHNGINGWKASIQVVKDKYPKGSN